MLNTDGFVVLAGNPQKWDDETRARCRPGGIHGTYVSSDLCAVQVDQHRRGRRSAELVETVYGWSVRLASGLDGNQILLGYRLTGRRYTKEEAIAFGTEWANSNPENREFYAFKSLMEGDK